jgi:ABC-type dipeptide/oligopeptide/nickel transport system permease subunit
MLSTGRAYIDITPWLSIFPGAAIMLVVLGFNLLGDGLRDILDPRLGPHVGDVPTKQ